MTESNSVTVPQQRSDWVMWLVWVAATCAGLVLTFPAIALLNADRSYQRVDDLVDTIGLLMSLSILICAATQHFAIRLFLPDERRWFTRSLFGWFAGILAGLGLAIIGLFLGTLVGFSGNFQPECNEICTAGIGAMLGLWLGLITLVAVFQRRVLQRYSWRSGWWLLAVLVGWGASAIPLGALSYVSGETLAGLFAKALATSLAMGLLAGGITGTALVYILRVGPSVAAQDAELPVAVDAEPEEEEPLE